MPDLLLYNGKIFTQDARLPHTNAIAIRDGKVLAIGEDEEIQNLATSTTRQIDLEEKRVIPGLIDAHFHFYEWALLQRGLVLGDTSSLVEVQQRVQKTAQETEPGNWIVGQGWNQENWPHPNLPTRIDLDRVAPNNPVILWRTDLHLAWVNTAALNAADITPETVDPDMGLIDRDKTGKPTGILREMAINLIRDVMPVVSAEETDTAMREAMKKAHKLGLTGVHDFRIMGGEDGPPALRAWQRLHANGNLNLRAWVMLPGELLDNVITLGLQTGFGDHTLQIGGTKFFSDGSIGSRTALMLEPFEDGSNGIPLTPMEEIARAISKAHQNEVSTAIHAIGDRAVRELLDVYTEVLGKAERQTKPQIPHRIEHVQHSHPDDLARLAPLGLVASVQPLHITDDYQMIEAACGSRSKWAYAFRDLLNAGTVLAFGSDCPVASPNPFWGIHAAVTRRRRDGTPAGCWNPSQCLTVSETIWGYTMGCAYASGQQDVLGSLTPGKLADMVVLNQDIFNVDPMDIAQTQVEMTVFNGKVVFQK